MHVYNINFKVNNELQASLTSTFPSFSLEGITSQSWSSKKENKKESRLKPKKQGGPREQSRKTEQKKKGLKLYCSRYKTKYTRHEYNHPHGGWWLRSLQRSQPSTMTRWRWDTKKWRDNSEKWVHGCFHRPEPLYDGTTALFASQKNKQASNQASKQSSKQASELRVPLWRNRSRQCRRISEKRQRKKKRNSLPVKPLYFSDSLWVISSRQSRQWSWTANHKSQGFATPLLPRSGKSRHAMGEGPTFQRAQPFILGIGFWQGRVAPQLSRCGRTTEPD